ncbi:sigma-70 family RNA polymerase sigma factor [Acidaminobacter hydrogenoformans]|uniref:RNA polymerase, sigma subunit, SigV n=1 Tax=Acidaminobacter hydrogenoformans DSM 2784 TaxID=1120920 RepID=A0A1G5RQH7_9FIRM|nr:sigma-70 family RNA polymerase sigma factor [Acidaminobacter hydrogenoformans]SCZ76355.1 RNA polymerase, sigma subunit, SigV [Acidaminobacter hydrogenoformans DSM 2784]
MNNRQIADYVTKNRESHYRLAYSYVKNPDDALDVIQESICKAIHSAHTLKSPEFIKTWYCRIVVNTALDLLRKQKKLVLTDDEAFEALHPGVNDTLQDYDLHQALDRLPGHYKTIVVLRYFEDMTLDDIAEVTGIPLSTVKTRLYKSLKMLRLELETDEKGGN